MWKKGDKKLAKREDTHKVEGKCRRGRRPKVQWEISLSDLERVGEEWKE